MQPPPPIPLLENSFNQSRDGEGRVGWVLRSKRASLEQATAQHGLETAQRSTAYVRSASSCYLPYSRTGIGRWSILPHGHR